MEVSAADVESFLDTPCLPSVEHGSGAAGQKHLAYMVYSFAVNQTKIRSLHFLKLWLTEDPQAAAAHRPNFPCFSTNA